MSFASIYNRVSDLKTCSSSNSSFNSTFYMLVNDKHSILNIKFVVVKSFEKLKTLVFKNDFTMKLISSKFIPVLLNRRGHIRRLKTHRSNLICKYVLIFVSLNHVDVKFEFTNNCSLDSTRLFVDISSRIRFRVLCLKTRLKFI